MKTKIVELAERYEMDTPISTAEGGADAKVDQDDKKETEQEAEKEKEHLSLKDREIKIRHLNNKDKCLKQTIETLVTEVDIEMLVDPFRKWEKSFAAREKYEIRKPPPYDKNEAYEQRIKGMKSALPGHVVDVNSVKVLDTSLQRIAFHKYEDYSLAQITREKVAPTYTTINDAIIKMEQSYDGSIEREKKRKKR